MKIAIMKNPLLTLATCGALAMTAASSSAQTAVTGALGYYTFDIPAGASIWTCGLVTKSDFSGAMTGITAGSPTSTISQSGAGWTAAGFSNHYVEIREGQWEGLVLDIVSNGTDTVVVDGDLGPSGFNLAGTEKYLIRKHATLGGIFPEGGGAGGFGASDKITLYDSNGDAVDYKYANGFGWYDPVLSVGANDIPLYPGQGFVATVGSAITVTIGGNEVSTVKDTPTMIPVYAGIINLIGLINPLVTTDVSDPLYPSTVAMGSMGFTDFLAGADKITQYSVDGALSVVEEYKSTGVGGIMYSLGPPAADATNTQIQVGPSLVISVGADNYYKQPSLLP